MTEVLPGRVSETPTTLVEWGVFEVGGKLLACKPMWCRVEIAGLRGWIRRAVIWGVYDGETFD